MYTIVILQFVCQEELSKPFDLPVSATQQLIEIFKKSQIADAAENSEK